MDTRRVVLLPGLTHACAWGSVAIMLAGAVLLAALPGGTRAIKKSVAGFHIEDTAEPLSSDDHDDLAVDPQVIVDNSYVGYTVWRLHGDSLSDWRVGFSNPAADAVIGHAVSECEGSPVLECFPALNSEGGEKYADLVRFARDSGSPVSVGVTALKTKDGAQRYFYSTITPVDDGHVVLNYHNLFDNASEGLPADYMIGMEMSDLQVLRAQLRSMETALDRVSKEVVEHGR